MVEKVIYQKTNRSHQTSKIAKFTLPTLSQWPLAPLLFIYFLLHARSWCMVWHVNCLCSKDAHIIQAISSNILKLSYLRWNLTVWDTVPPFAIWGIILCCWAPKQSMTSICTFSISSATISKWEYTCCTIGITTNG